MMGPHLHRSFLDVARRRATTLYQGAAGGRVWYQTRDGWASRPPESCDVIEMRDRWQQPNRRRV